MPKLEDKLIRLWIKSNTRFEAKADGNGLYLRFRQTDKHPMWFLRFKVAKIEQRMIIGKYPAMSLANARKEGVKNKADLLKGLNPAQIKRDLKKETAREAIKQQSAQTVADLVDDFFKNKVDGIQKNAHQRRLRVNKHLLPHLGKFKLEDVQPMDIVRTLDKVKAQSKTAANDILSDLKQLFNYAIKRHLMTYNPAQPFNSSDAGGKENARERWLNKTELTAFFKALRDCPNVTKHHYQVIKLLLLFGNRKSELLKAKRKDFDLDKKVWHMPHHNKVNTALDIPLPESAIVILNDLLSIQVDGTEYLFPAKSPRTQNKGHICVDYVNKLVREKVIPLMGEVEHFTIHDFRHTMRSHLSELGINIFVSERCLNHKITGIQGVYDNFDYLPERTEAMNLWAKRLDDCEAGLGDDSTQPVLVKNNVIPFKKAI